MKREKRVAVLVDTATGWGRRLIRGLLRYAREQSNWHLWIEARGQDEPLRLPSGWSGDGIIARVATQAIAQEVRSARVPVVNVSSIELNDIKFPCVTNDVVGSAELAVEHFANRGLENFAYCGPQRLAWVRLHCDTFTDCVQSAGFQCTRYRPHRSVGTNWSARRVDMARWVGELPKPVGVFTWGYRLGRELIEVCRDEGILIPEQVAILGGDDDELLCQASNPALSGIRVDSEQVGFRAAELLDRLMTGGKAPKRPILIPPLGVTERRSTEVLAIADPNLAMAVRFIREHASAPITVADVLKAVPISRRQLERDFQRVLSRTPASEIRRVHLERAKDLLTSTDYSIPEVALNSGFGSPEYLAQVFRRDVGTTPLKYRGRIRGSRPGD